MEFLVILFRSMFTNFGDVLFWEHHYRHLILSATKYSISH